MPSAAPKEKPLLLPPAGLLAPAGLLDAALLGVPCGCAVLSAVLSLPVPLVSALVDGLL